MISIDAPVALRALRILCAVPFIPHILDKCLVPANAREFFAAAGLRPTALVLVLAILIESACTACLLLDRHVREAALVAALFLICASVAVLRVNGMGWLWQRGGCEYTVFWAAGCVIVALTA